MQHVRNLKLNALTTLLFAPCNQQWCVVQTPMQIVLMTALWILLVPRSSDPSRFFSSLWRDARWDLSPQSSSSWEILPPKHINLWFSLLHLPVSPTLSGKPLPSTLWKTSTKHSLESLYQALTRPSTYQNPTTMQLPAILFFFLCPFISSVFSNPLGQDKVQVTVQLSSNSPNSLGKPDLSPVAPLSWGYVGTGTYYIVSLVDDYALVPSEYATTAQTDIILRYVVSLSLLQWSPFLYCVVYETCPLTIKIGNLIPLTGNNCGQWSLLNS